ncbi:PEBP-like protein [Heliocybe sulcata]|uniref:PEBP-like protein n=1 Tax=Heliocybe sulcata TaxID=5364 RepID=A0A5C3ND93_9AGAM|nr:PEBP-like protein [Heliocybe sulcata]
MFASTALFSVALASLAAAAESYTQGDLQTEASVAHLTQSGIVPSLLPTFDPLGYLNVSFPAVGAIGPGQALTQDQVHDQPTVVFTAANSSVSYSGTTTVIMADAGPVGTDESQGQTRHWLSYGASITGNGPYTLDTSSGTNVTEYAGPGPAPGSGAHRYVIMLFEQTSSFNEPADAGSGVQTFNLTGYIQSSGLGPLYAATYFTVENGTATQAPSSTAPVATSTLPAFQGLSGSGTTTGGSNSPSSTGGSSSGAMSVKVGLGALLAAVPLVGAALL